MGNLNHAPYIMHEGVKRRSGRYPWGSGKDPYQRATNFLNEVSKLKKQGLSEIEIATSFGWTTAEYRNRKSSARNFKRQEDVAMVRRLREKGVSEKAIAERLGLSTATVHNYADGGATKRADEADQVYGTLKTLADQHRYVDYGTGVEQTLGVSKRQLEIAVQDLVDEGYHARTAYIPQLGTKNTTPTRVLCRPDVTASEMHINRNKIHIPGTPTDDGTNIPAMGPLMSVSSKKIAVRYGEDGGGDMDGVIELRRGVKELDLGASRYAQVRIPVDGTHYLKGMAIYADDLPSGVDIRINTPKKRSKVGSDKHAVMKPLELDKPDMPFGSLVRQAKPHTDSKGKVTPSSLYIINEEGAWNDWSNTLASQFLSKQRTSIAKEQLQRLRDRRQKTLDEIMALENPVVRKKLLMAHADQLDSDAVYLKAEAFPRQATQVILPVRGLKETEIYAPNFRHGERVALVRYPHAGTFEIPELRVNKRNAQGRKIVGDALDAVGINPKVAERLAGADFDGDTVVVIPLTEGRSIKTSPPLRGLKGFDPKLSYPERPGMKYMSKKATGQQMGSITNLITDMQLQGASPDEVARAVRHSYVVIDAAKHKLDYRQSELDNDIPQLKRKYQRQADGKVGGSATIISRAKSPEYVPARKLRSAAEGGSIDPDTGKLIYIPTGKGFQKTHRMSVTEDATTLMSVHAGPMERIYADHANHLKKMAQQTRLEVLKTPKLVSTPEARKKYRAEVDSLKEKIKTARMAASIERKAQLVAASKVALMQEASPGMTKADVAKAEALHLATARQRLRKGEPRPRVNPTPQEWEAIMNGGVTNSMMEDIVQYSDTEHLQKLAMPKQRPIVSPNQRARAHTLKRNGGTAAEIADSLGVSVTTVHDILKEGGIR